MYSKRSTSAALTKTPFLFARTIRFYLFPIFAFNMGRFYHIQQAYFYMIL